VPSLSSDWSANSRAVGRARWRRFRSVGVETRRAAGSARSHAVPVFSASTERRPTICRHYAAYGTSSDVNTSGRANRRNGPGDRDWAAAISGRHVGS